MRTLPPQSPLLKATLFLATSNIGAPMFSTHASKHLICVPCEPKGKEEPFDVRKLADNFNFKEVPIYHTSDEDTDSVLLGPKRRSSFLQPAKNFKRLGLKLGRQTKW